jgi:DNA-binding transcriptional MerR regulator
MEPLLTPADAARRLSVAAATVRAMERRGVLKAAVKTERGGRLFRLADVEALRVSRDAGRQRGTP